MASASGLRAGTLILGIGNILLRDDGVGVRVVEALSEKGLPAGTELCDGGTYGIDLLDEISHRRALIVIDAADGGGEPGTVYRFTGEDLFQDEKPALSLHEFGLRDVLKAAGHLGCAPEAVVIFGIQPKEIRMSLELSDEVAAAVPRVVDLVTAEVKNR